MAMTLFSQVKSKSNQAVRSVASLFALLLMLSVLCATSVSATESQEKPQAAPVSIRYPVSILDEVGQLSGVYSPSVVASWKAQALRGSAQSQEARLRLAEYQLAHDQDPESARVAFGQIEQSTDPKSVLYGIACYDSAEALYYEGAYRQSLRAFSYMLKRRPAGIDPRRCALWLRHADACAGYHAQNAALGIPEPIRLDPYCAAAGLAEVLRTMGLNSGRGYVLAHCRVTGEGSNLTDVLNAARSMGLSAYPLSTDDKGLMALHHAMVAYVENDHFVALVGASRTGVTYLCSDCGPWPGGQVHVSWKQWHAMLPTEFVAVAQPGTDWDTTLKEILAQGSPKPVRVSFVGDLASLGIHNELQLHALISILRGHVFLGNANGSVSCGNKPSGLECTPFIRCCKDCQKKSHHTGAATAGDPVNLATGEEEYEPDPDLTVYNPVGPSIYWDRVYDSLRGPSTTYQSDDYGVGWSTSYNLAVYDAGFGGAGTKYIVFSNGSRAQFTASAVPSSTMPIVLCTPQTNGFPLEMEWTYDTTTGKNFYRIRSHSGAAWDTSETSYATVGGNSYYFPIGKKYDIVGNAIVFNYSTTLGPSGLPLLSTITNSRGTALLTINRSGSYSNISSVSDSNGRSVYYTTATYNNVGVVSPNPVSYQELNQVSQIVATGTGSPAYRWKYGYGLVAIPDVGTSEQVNFLTSIGVPSPTGSGSMVQATLTYAADNCNVTTVTDGNGNVATYTSVNSSGAPTFPSTYTKVSIANSSGAVSYSYVSGYSTNMSQTTTTDGKSNIIETDAYTSTNDPYMPSSVTNANGNTWTYTWDTYGNLLTETTPRSVVHTYTIAHPSATYPIISQVTKFQETAGASSHNPFSFTYYALGSNGFGGLVHTSVRPLAGAGGGAPETTTLTYDALGNVTAATLPGNNAGSETLAYNYTTDGTYSTTESLGLPLTVTDALSHTEHFRYDALGDTISATDPLGNETDYSFDVGDELLTATYPATGQSGTGRSYTQYAHLYTNGPLTSVSLYGENGSLFKQISYTYGLEGEALGVSGSTKNASTTYDAIYRPTTVADGLGNTTKYLYNGQGYLDSVLYPRYSGPTPVYNTTTGTWSNVTGSDSIRCSSYDAAGDPLTKVDGNGVSTTFVYSDPESKLSQINVPAVSFAGDSAVGYTRDGFGNITQSSDATQAGGSDSYAYDDYDRAYYDGRTFAYPGMTSFNGYVQYYCNPDGSRSSVASTVGTTTYSYDQGGRLLSLTNPYSEAYSFTYDSDSRILTQTSAGSNIVTYVYNALGQRTDIKYTTISGTLRCEFSSIVHNPAGQITSYTTNIPGTPAYNGTTTFTYDNACQLLTESFAGGTYAKSFVYDAANTLGPGNPTTFNGSSYSFNADNQNSLYTEDGNGNTTATNTGYSFSYDNFNHTYAINSGSSILQAASTRVDDGLQWWRYDYSTGSLLFFLYDGDAQTTSLYYTGAVSQYQTIGPNGHLNYRALSLAGALVSDIYYAFDPQGNYALALDASGNVTASTIVDAYGVSLISGKPASSGMQWGEGYYNGGITPYLLKARRCYDGLTGRFMSRDPIGYGGGINQYAFAGNDPVNKADPSGLDGGDPERTTGGVDDPTDPVGGGAIIGDSNRDADGHPLPLPLAYFPGNAEADAAANAADQAQLPIALGGSQPCPEAAGEDESGSPSDVTATNDPGGGVTFTKIPTLVVDYNKHPQMADNIWQAQKAGWSPVLTYGGSNSGDANRASALADVPRVPGFQRDEYPFAGSDEGGSGWVGHVPGRQNAAVGGDFGALVRSNNLQPGDQFGVTVINHPGGP